jgi:hypothetical protein
MLTHGGSVRITSHRDALLFEYVVYSGVDCFLRPKMAGTAMASPAAVNSQCLAGIRLKGVHYKFRRSIGADNRMHMVAAHVGRMEEPVFVLANLPNRRQNDLPFPGVHLNGKLGVGPKAMQAGVGCRNTRAWDVVGSIDRSFLTRQISGVAREGNEISRHQEIVRLWPRSSPGAAVKWLAMAVGIFGRRK